ncbi:unnamed protein product [Brachionus calyciflorus]|uniref:Uncharacterized protein n=1 Tax=Brachionus calyciflorus TaxID=104777 RepID=A0A813M4A4_9BILA|nr:unnamed protein product [Brachionus calyciflorus]
MCENDVDEVDEPTSHRKQLVEINQKSKSLVEINHELEIKYPRTYYEAIIIGEGLENVTSIHNRIREMKKCIGIQNTTSLQTVADEYKKNQVKVTVDNYKDFLKITGPWPKDSFSTGVSVIALPLS